VKPWLEEVRQPFTINTSRGVQVDPGGYTFNDFNASIGLQINDID